MEAEKSPIYPQEYHLCIKVTPRVLSTQYFESSGIESMFKLEVLRGNSRFGLNLMKRNLHEEALLGFYKSQACYFELSNFKSYRNVQFLVKLSEVAEAKGAQEKVIFQHTFCPYNFIRDYIEEDIKKSTHIIKKDYTTEFDFNVYIQSTKEQLLERLRADHRTGFLEESDSFDDVATNGKKSLTSRSNKSSPFRARLSSSEENFFGKRIHSKSPQLRGFYRGQSKEVEPLNLQGIQQNPFLRKKYEPSNSKRSELGSNRSSPMRQYLKERRTIVNSRRYQQNLGSDKRPLERRSTKKRFEEDNSQEEELHEKQKRNSFKGKKPIQGRYSRQRQFTPRKQRYDIYTDGQGEREEGVELLTVTTNNFKTNLPWVLLIVLLLAVIVYQSGENSGYEVASRRKENYRDGADEDEDWEVQQGSRQSRRKNRNKKKQRRNKSQKVSSKSKASSKRKKG